MFVTYVRIHHGLQQKGDTMHSGPTHATAGLHPLDFIGDHLAIDFINTLRTPDGVLYDVFETDKDVRDWLFHAGVSTPKEPVRWPQGALLWKARQLREIALKAVEAMKAGKRPSLDTLNLFLEHAASHPQLVMRPGSKIEIKRVRGSRTLEEFLSPIAEAVAELLADGDFDLIRQCEGEECSLWFYDRTKAHRRRWCSPAACGNRAKVAAFRARVKANAN